MTTNADANNDIVEETEKGSSSIKSDEFFKKNINMVVGGIIIVLVAIGLYWYISNNQKEKEATASLALSRVKIFYERAEFDKALKGDPTIKIRGESIIGLREIVENYGSTSAGKMAALMSGDILLSQKKYSEALSMYEAAQGSDSKILAVGAKAGMAACKESEKKYAEAAPMYEEAAQQMKEIGDEAKYRYFAALSYEKSGNKDKAKELYTLITKENRDTEFKDLAIGAMSRLGMIIE